MKTIRSFLNKSNKIITTIRITTRKPRKTLVLLTTIQCYRPAFRTVKQASIGNDTTSSFKQESVTCVRHAIVCVVGLISPQYLRKKEQKINSFCLTTKRVRASQFGSGNNGAVLYKRRLSMRNTFVWTTGRNRDVPICNLGEPTIMEFWV